MAFGLVLGRVLFTFGSFASLNKTSLHLQNLQTESLLKQNLYPYRMMVAMCKIQVNGF